MKKKVSIFLVCLLWVFAAAAQSVINPKGTRIAVDTSKWKLSGTDIYSKHTGNTGIGIAAPLYKLDVSATANPLRLTGLQSGAATDSVLTVLNGVVRYASPGRLITDTSLYKYDGTLAANRTITFGGKTLSLATGGTAFNITGLTSGAVTDSLLTISPSTSRVGRISISQLIDSTTVSNGLSMVGNDVQLGGTLTKKDTIVTSSANTLAVRGLQAGAPTDSMIVAEANTGVLRKMPLYSVTTLKTTTTQSNSTTTAATINALSFTAVAGNSYRIRMWLVYSAGATTTGIRLGPNTFSGGNFWYSTTINSSTTASQVITGFNAVNILQGTSSRATTGNVATIDMTVEATSTATVSFQFASEVAGSAITIQAGSRLEYEIIN